MNTDRYDRQERIPGWKQESLRAAHVLIAGAGALGNELLKNLVLLGVGHLLVVDVDRLERSNLSRTVLFQEADIGQPKAEVAAARAARLNPEVDVRYLHGDLLYDVGLGFYRHSDLVVSGLDNIAARSQVGIYCSLAGVPFLDGGMWALGGEIRWFLPGAGACFECTLDEESHRRAYERWSCMGLRRPEEIGQPPAPTTISTAAVIGGMLAGEVVRYLCGWEVHGGQAVVYNGFSLTMHRTLLPRETNCPYHRAYQEVVELAWGAADRTARDLLQRAAEEIAVPATLLLGRDLLLSFHCPRCNQEESVHRVLGLVPEAQALCPHCGQARQARVISSLEGSAAQADHRLGELGIPPGEVLAIQRGEQLRFYELTGDITSFWRAPCQV